MNKTFTWRLLTPGELTDVYLQEMRRDFPAGELKPLSMILTSEAEGLAHTWGVFDGETLAAYLLMVRPEGSAISQLDYFAVVPAYRAGGLGAKLLAALPEYEAGCESGAQDLEHGNPGGGSVGNENPGREAGRIKYMIAK